MEYPTQSEIVVFLLPIFPRGTNVDSAPVPDRSMMMTILSARSLLLEYSRFGYDEQHRHYIEFVLFAIQALHERYVLTMRGIFTRSS